MVISAYYLIDRNVDEPVACWDNKCCAQKIYSVGYNKLFPCEEDIEGLTMSYNLSKNDFFNHSKGSHFCSSCGIGVFLGIVDLNNLDPPSFVGVEGGICSINGWKRLRRATNKQCDVCTY